MYVTVRTLFGTTINKMFIKFTDNVVCVGDEKNKSEKKKKKIAADDANNKPRMEDLEYRIELQQQYTSHFTCTSQQASCGSVGAAGKDSCVCAHRSPRQRPIQ